MPYSIRNFFSSCAQGPEIPLSVNLVWKTSSAPSPTKSLRVVTKTLPLLRWPCKYRWAKSKVGFESKYVRKKDSKFSCCNSPSHVSFGCMVILSYFSLISKLKAEISVAAVEENDLLEESSYWICAGSNHELLCKGNTVAKIGVIKDIF